MRYRPEIDGLRTLAVLPVVLFHAGFETFSGGFVGVDIFFVISGYLITTILLEEIDQGGLSITAFYERRARRILPALFVVLLVCLPLTWWWLMPREAKLFFKSLATVPVFASNVLFWQESGYFDASTELKPLLHTWSLAVEEQFYVLFPLLLWAVSRRGRRFTRVSIGVAFAMSLAVALWATAAKPEAAFYLLPARAWELLTGSFVALQLHRTGTSSPPVDKRWHGAAAAAGVGLIVAAILLFDDETPFPGPFAMVPAAGAALIILFASAHTLTGRLLGQPLLVGTGLVSYSAYLWHQPLFAFARHRADGSPSTATMAGLTLLTFALAYGSWRWVEAPFRNRHRLNRTHIAWFATAGSVAFFVIGIVGYLAHEPYKAWWLASQPASVRHTFALIERSQEQAHHAKQANGRHGDSPCRFNVERLTPSIEASLSACYARHGKGIVILGDSHAVDLFGLFIAKATDPFIVGVTQPGCRPYTRDPKCHYTGFLRFIEHHGEIFSRVIFEQAAFYLLRTEHDQGTRRMLTDIPLAAPVAGIDIDHEHVQAVHRYLSEVDRYVPVTWFGPRLEPHITDNAVLRLGCTHAYNLRPGQPELYARLDAAIRSEVKRWARLSFVSQNESLRLQFPRDFMDCDKRLWTDGDHYSAAGEEQFAARLDTQALLHDTSL